MPNFTTEDLLLFLFDEMSNEKRKELEQTLQSNWVLQQKYQVLEEAYTRLKQMKLPSPRTKTLAAIMQYAEESMHLSN